MDFNKKEQDFITAIGKRIVVIRMAQKLSQIELAVRINIEDSALRRIESGRTNPTIKTLLRVAEGLGVSIQELLPIVKE